MKKLNKILLIDDDEVTNYINRGILESLNIAEEIQVIEDGERAFNYLIRCAGIGSLLCPEFVIFDHQMPNMDGTELIEALNEVNFMKENKVVFMFLGVNAARKDLEVLKDLGIREFASKPLSVDHVMDVYRKYW